MSENLGLAKSIDSTLKKFTKNEESKFRVWTSFKMTMIPFLSVIIVGWMFILLLEVDYLFFKSHELIGIDNFRSTYYDYIFNKMSNFVPYLSILFIFLIVAGLYVSDILLRPFRIIGDYCEKALEDENASYDPDFFNDLSLLTRFAEFFFSIIDNFRKNGELKQIEIPSKYTKIHNPRFETMFFFHYSFYLFICLSLVSVITYTFAMGLHDELINFARETLPQQKQVLTFLQGQNGIFSSVLIAFFVTQLILYIWLASHLYLKVATPAFGVFATMRSFLKGNHSARVHLIGFPYLRPACRKLNKYLDFIERKYTNKNN
ncbi:MAG: hypothetical protein GY909_04370 [Oligoflexia bacterium]|nr:hypothetical protein [Oligoflexia bacterium]